MSEVPETPLHKMLPAWVGRMLGSAVGVLAILLMAAMAGIAYLIHTHELKEAKRDRQMEIVTTNLQVLNEQTAIRQIIEEKLPKLQPEVQARIAMEFYDGARRSGIKAWALLAVADKESTWDVHAVSPAGAMGIMQLMPGTAIAYARSEGLPITSKEQIFEPVFNVRNGIRVLVDNYRGAVLTGKSPEGDTTRALWSYNGGGEAYARQVMEKAAFYQKRLEAPLQGKIPTPKND